VAIADEKGGPNSDLSDLRFDKRRVSVFGREMAVADVGQGDPIVFLHGNPTSSYMWRNVVPYVQEFGRCIAPDLIGMGDSDKLPNSGPGRYTFSEHRQFLDELLAKLGVGDKATLVLHDWGSALGFDWARRHPQSVRGIAYMEALVRPLLWNEFPEPVRALFLALRSPAGESMVLEQNIFVEQVLRAGVLRPLSNDEMAHYRRPFETPGEDRRPTLSWPREIPIDGEPADVAESVQAYASWLTTAEVPKLFINGDPGAVLTGGAGEFCRSWLHQQEVTVRGGHFLQEDSPDEVGCAIADWFTSLVATNDTTELRTGSTSKSASQHKTVSSTDGRRTPRPN
jgi:haloalkane dehalogenase